MMRLFDTTIRGYNEADGGNFGHSGFKATRFFES
jgi:hypothetical protein